MPQEKDTSLLNLAMHYGVFLGLFWALKYMVLIASNHIPVLIYLYYVLNGGTFLMIYIYYFKFRDIDPNKQQSVWHCIGFIMALCFFASFFESIMIYIHLLFIDPSFYITRITPVLTAMVEAFPYPADVKAMTLNIVLNKMFYIVSTMFGNLVLGSFLGVALALIIGNKKK